MLYLIASPIGNLGDITLRALEIIRKCDYLLAENTQHTRGLLHHYEIKKPLVSYHQFNEKERENQVLADLQAGQHIGLITDAGTPGISDPGARLVELCRAEGIAYSSLPGPSSVAVAMSLAGDWAEKFQFIGFLSKKTSERLNQLKEAFNYPGATLFFESPHRVIKTLEAILSLQIEHTLLCFRELTKIHEQILKGSSKDLLAHFTAHLPRGEFVFLLKPEPEAPSFSDLSLEAHVEKLENEKGLSTKEAIKEVARIRNLSKRTVYQAVHQEPQDG